MRLLLAGLPHTRLDTENVTCAYTQKAVKFVKAMRARGYDIHTHWGDENPDLDALPAWPDADTWEPFNQRACDWLDDTLTEGDVILLAGGRSQAPLLRYTTGPVVYPIVEYGVGYEGILAGTHHVFESYAWMHYVYGRQGVDGSWYDAVIPNPVDPDDFPPATRTPDDYLLYVGRVIERKGVRVAVQVAERTGRPLLVAGPISDELDISGHPLVTMLGPVDAARRGDLMSRAHATLVPTVYVEPFGGVAVEAMAAGCPVLTTDWGAFTETVTDHTTGFRCRTLGEFVWSVDAAGTLDREAIQSQTLARFGLERVGEQYAAYFGQIAGLYGDGWCSDDHAGVSMMERYRTTGGPRP